MVKASTNSIWAFRYFKEEHALEILRTGLWKIGRLTELNDPFDCQPILNNAPKVDDERRFTADYFRQFNDVVGVLCYSAKIDDPVIWSHYADAHRGIALGFRYLCQGNVDGLFQVNYGEDRPTLDYNVLEELRLRNEMEQLKKVIQAGFTVNSSILRYEDEFRHFLILDYKSNRLIGRNYFRPISKYEFSAVILGEKCTLTEKDIRRLITKSEFYEIRMGSWGDGIPEEDILITRAKMDRNKFKMNVELSLSLRTKPLSQP